MCACVRACVCVCVCVCVRERERERERCDRVEMNSSSRVCVFCLVAIFVLDF